MVSRIHHEDQCYLVQELYKHTTQPHGEWGSTLHPSRAFSTTRLYLQTKLVTNKEMKVVNPHVKEEEQSCSRFLQMIKVDCLTGIQLRWFILQNSWHLSLHNRVWGTDFAPNEEPRTKLLRWTFSILQHWQHLLQEHIFL